MPVELATMMLTTLLAAGAPPAEAPDIDLLELLGSFETADGKWLDPGILEEPLGDAPPVTAPESGA